MIILKSVRGFQMAFLDEIVRSFFNGDQNGKKVVPSWLALNQDFSNMGLDHLLGKR